MLKLKLAYVVAFLSVVLPIAIDMIGIWWNGIVWSVL